MKIPFKKISVLTACTALCFALLRFLQLFFCVEQKTGFFKEGYAGVGTELSIVIFIFALTCAVFAFSEKKVPVKIPENSLTLSVGFIILSMFLIADLCFFPATFSAKVWQAALYLVTGVISALILLFTGASYFIKIDFLSFLGFKNGHLAPVTAIIPLIFWIIRTIIFFSFYTEIAVISDLVFEIIAQLSVMLFLLYIAFFKNEIDPVKTKKRILPLLVIAFLTCICCSLPQITLKLTGFGERLHTFNINNVSMLGIVIFLVIFYFGVFAENNLKDKTRKHVKEKNRFVK